VRVRLQWLDGGAVALDSGDKPAFTPLEDVPGLYRLILTEGAEGQRAWIYIGETDNLRRRLAGNYRNPGPPRAPSGAANSRLVLHPSRHLPMDAERRARALVALKALLVPYLRSQRAESGRRDTEPGTEPSLPTA